MNSRECVQPEGAEQGHVNLFRRGCHFRQVSPGVSSPQVAVQTTQPLLPRSDFSDGGDMRSGVKRKAGGSVQTGRRAPSM